MPRVIIAGCGFVGLATARLFHQAGWQVLGFTHSAESARRLTAEPFPIAAADITNPPTLNSLGDFAPDVVIHCASSSRGDADAYRAVYLRGCENLLRVLRPRRFIFTSSTSVYAQISGESVTEESPAGPARETGQILRQTEDLILNWNASSPPSETSPPDFTGIVARLAGIYGPGRSVLLRKFLAGEAVIEGDGSRIINQVHRDDIAAALLILAERGAPGIYNVSDNAPMPQREFYHRLAAHFSLPLPPSGPVNRNRKRGLTSKRVSNARLRALGWTPRYPSFFDALQHDPGLIDQARPNSP